MSRAVGWLLPAALAAATVVASKALLAPGPVSSGIALGVFLAAAQSYLSAATLHWTRNTKAFGWVFIGGIFMRLLFLVFVAVQLIRVPQFSFSATLVTMVLATTAFLVAEAATCLKG